MFRRSLTAGFNEEMNSEQLYPPKAGGMKVMSDSGYKLQMEIRLNAFKSRVNVDL